MKIPQKKKNYKKLSQEEWLSEFSELVILHMEDDQFNMDFLGRKMDTSRRHLQRKVKKITGQTPKTYINKVRLKEALRLLESGEIKSIKILANKIGFSNPDYFSSLFKKRFGKVPSSFLFKGE